MWLQAGIHTEALLKFMSNSDENQIALYKNLRKVIVQHRSPFAPHQLWEGLYDMVTTFCTFFFLSFRYVRCICLCVQIEQCDQHSRSRAKMTARLHAFFKHDENQVMVRPILLPCTPVFTLASISTCVTGVFFSLLARSFQGAGAQDAYGRADIWDYYGLLGLPLDQRTGQLA